MTPDSATSSTSAPLTPATTSAKCTSLERCFYHYGVFVARRPIAMMTLAAVVVAVACLPLSPLTPRHNATTKTATTTTTFRSSPNCHEKVSTSPTPIWLTDDNRAAWLQRFVVYGVVLSPGRRNRLRREEIDAALMASLRLTKTIRRFRSKTGVALENVCLKGGVAFEAKDKEIDKDDNNNNKNQSNASDCLIISPAVFWKNETNGNFSGILSSLGAAHFRPRLFRGAVSLAEAALGVPWSESGVAEWASSSARWRRRRRKLVAFAASVFLRRRDEGFLEELKEELGRSLGGEFRPRAKHEDCPSPATHILFHPAVSPLRRHSPLASAFILLFVYFYFSTRKMVMVKSKSGLAVAAVATIAASLATSFGVCARLDLGTPMRGGVVFPYLVLIIGLENVLVLTKSVVAQPIGVDRQRRLARGLAKDGVSIAKHGAIVSAILLAGLATPVPAVGDFCLVGVVAVASSFFLQMTFFVSVVSIDVCRVDLEDVLYSTPRNDGAVLDTGAEISLAADPRGAVAEWPRTSPSLTQRRKRKSSFPRLSSFSSSFSSSSPSSSKRLRVVDFVTEKRFVLRGVIFGAAAWIAYVAALYCGDLDDAGALRDAWRELGLFGADRSAVDGNATVVERLDRVTQRHASSHLRTLVAQLDLPFENRFVSVLPNVFVAASFGRGNSSTILSEEANAFEEEDIASGLLFGSPSRLARFVRFARLSASDDSLFSLRHEESMLLLFLFGFVCLVVFVLAYTCFALYFCVCSKNYAEWRAASCSSAAAADAAAPSAGAKIVAADSVAVLPLLTGNDAAEVEASRVSSRLFAATDTSGAKVVVFDVETGAAVARIARWAAPDSAKSCEPRRPSSGSIEDSYVGKSGAESGWSIDELAAPEDSEDSVSSGSNEGAKSRVAAVWCLCLVNDVLYFGCGDGSVETHVFQPATKPGVVCRQSGDAGLQSGVTHLEAAPASVAESSMTANSPVFIVAAHLDGMLDFFLHETYPQDGATMEGCSEVLFLNQSVRAHKTPLGDLVVGGGKVVTGCNEGMIKVSRIQDGVILHHLSGHESAIVSLTFDPGADEAQLVSSDAEGTVMTWSLSSGLSLHKLRSESRPSSGLCLHKLRSESKAAPVGVFLSASRLLVVDGVANSVSTFARDSGALLHRVPFDAGFRISSAALIGDEDAIAVASDAGVLGVFDLECRRFLGGVALPSTKTTTKTASTTLTTRLSDGAVVVVVVAKSGVSVVHFPTGLNKKD